MKLAYRGLCRLTPHVFVDTTGCAFTYLVARVLFGCDQVVAYVHYPTISTDMLKLVFERRRAAYNHSIEISSSRIRTAIKLMYYALFAALYGAVGSLATVVLVRETLQPSTLLCWSELNVLSKPGQLYVDLRPCKVVVEIRRMEEPDPDPVPSVSHY